MTPDAPTPTDLTPTDANLTAPTPTDATLTSLGWQDAFACQTTDDDLTQTPPARITEIHRSGMTLRGATLETTIAPNAEATVGDWMLYDPVLPNRSRLLTRKSLIKRRAPGSDRAIQLIAANVDTLFIVSSCNHDFNVARLERFAALAFEAGITPVILLTKADLCPDPAPFLEEARSISPLVQVLTLDARGSDPRAVLAPWCQPGQTVAFLGSSGVGKSTLTNALRGDQAVPTQTIREDDAKGRHTTTHRQLHPVPGGCLVLDTPGMRELQLADVAAGIEDLFADLGQLAATCRFNDCAHEAEPGCAVQAAIARGEVTAARLARWKKLLAEESFNSASLYDRRVMQKALGKPSRAVPKNKRGR